MDAAPRAGYLARMKRRGFLGKLLGGIAAVPVVAKALEAEAAVPVCTFSDCGECSACDEYIAYCNREDVLVDPDLSRDLHFETLPLAESTEWTLEVGGSPVTFTMNGAIICNAVDS